MAKIQVNTALDISDFQLLEKICKETNISKAHYVRDVVLKNLRENNNNNVVQ